MANLVLRTVKGSPLTNLEVDNNFSNINVELGTVNSNVGAVTNLTTSGKANLVVAVNELKSNIGVLSNLTTTEKSNLVAAINELQSESTSNVTITGGTIQFATISNVRLGSNVTSTTANATTFQGNLAGGNVVVTTASATTFEGNLAGGNVNVTGNVNGSGGVFTGNVQANFFIGSGALLTGISAGGGSGLFNTSISGFATANVTTVASNVYNAPSTSGKRYVLHSVHVTNITGTTTGNITGALFGTTYSNTAIVVAVPVPANSAVELLKKPKVLQPNDYIQLQADANNTIHATLTIEEQTNTTLFGGGVDITSANTYTDLHTATANSVIESILLVNDDATNDVKASVVFTDGSNNIQGYYCFDMIVPADATVEILEQPKFLQNAYKVRVLGNQANRLEALIAGKVIS